MEPIELELEYVKSTKNTHVYGDDKEGAPLPSVYIKKGALPEKAPERLKVTISA